ncbi:MAG TPA: hypothetical protein VNU71_14305, partial [Burkholderiaceae bacterium]|nr:hypothetical protein [Burkholderiaceae bacterium]
LRTRGALDGSTLAAAPPSARAACSAHRFIAYALCLDRECERPRFRASADCSRMIADKRRREDH